MERDEAKANEGDLRIWHIPQLPGEVFFVSVASPVEGKRILDILADYDLFQIEHNIKPDYSNASGLEVFENGEWVDWNNKDGKDIDALEIGEDGQLIEAV